MTSFRVKSDTVIAILLLTLGAVLWFDILDAPSQARSYPKFMIALTAIPTIVLLLRPLLTKKKDKFADLKVTMHRRVFLCLLSTVLYVVAVRIVGYYAATPLFIAGIMVYLGARKWYIVAGTSLVMTIFIYLMFSRLLLISLPKGIFF